MEKFEFKSAVCTSREQSEKLLALGLKKETADCMYSVMTKSYNGCYILEEDRQYNLILFRQEEVQSVGFSHYEHIPAWSLHRLMEIVMKGDKLGCITHNIHQNNVNSYYELVIASIEHLIKIDEFNKDYLEEKR